MAILRRLEQQLIGRRSRPADMQASVGTALSDALGGEPVPAAIGAAGQAIAYAVAAHAASFAPRPEPAYHNQHHQAEATLAMGWLCAAARRLGLIDRNAALAGVLAMAGHDLRHDGLIHPDGTLETRAAALTLGLGARAGLDAATLVTMIRVILATNPVRPANQREADDLLCHLAQEADRFGSLTPELGWRLGRAMAWETGAAGRHAMPPFDSYAERLQLLRGCGPFTPAGRMLGLAASVTNQITALARLGGGDAALGAARLDATPPAVARADYLAALAEAERP